MLRSDIFPLVSASDYIIDHEFGCVKIHRVKKKWIDALSICKQESATLIADQPSFILGSKLKRLLFTEQGTTYTSTVEPNLDK